MHEVTVSETIIVRGMRLEADVPYLINDTGAGSLLMNRELVKCRDGLMRPTYRLVKARSCEGVPINPNDDYNGRTIRLFRGGGFGDILMMTPTIRRIKAMWPESRVVVHTMPEYGEVLQGLDCETAPGFLKIEDIRLGDALVFFEGVIEDNPRAENWHGIDLFAQRAGVIAPDETLELEDAKIYYVVTKDEAEWAVRQYPKTGRRRIAVQVLASSAVRTYPSKLLLQVIDELIAQDIEVFLFGKYQQVETDRAGVVNLTNYELSFRQSAAVLWTCDAALVPDSAWQHVAGALGIPTVALFGSFPAELRIPKQRAVEITAIVHQPEAACAPCFHHESGVSKFPENGPCALAGFCCVLAMITPGEIVKSCHAALHGGYDRAEARMTVHPVVYDFHNHRIGDTVAAIFLLSIYTSMFPHTWLTIINRGAIDVSLLAPRIAHEFVTSLDGLETSRRLNFEFGNLWIAAPSAWRDGHRIGFDPDRVRPEPTFDVGIHCLTGADYNTKRNHDPEQFAALAARLREAGLVVYEVDPTGLTTKEEIVEKMDACRMWIGGDTGFTHVFAMRTPDRPIVAIYSDDSQDWQGFEEERKSMVAFWNGYATRMSSTWSSDPLTTELHKFVMKNNQVDINKVFEKVLELAGRVA